MQPISATMYHPKSEPSLSMLIEQEVEALQGTIRQIEGIRERFERMLSGSAQLQ